MAAHRMFRTIALAIAMVIAASGLVYSVSAAPAAPAVAAPGGTFDPSNIISDTQFFDSGSMNEQGIQNFIQGQNCTPRDGVPCLKDYRETTPTKGAQGTGHCAQYTGAASESAARIIAKVAVACGISPKVLLVLMQKEQSLLTNPSAYGYERTMGWGCPDTAACNSLYFGFFNQVYRSAWQFREYTKNPGEWRYRVGSTYVQYHPNADCGGTTLNIKNQATANLYNYTPYQPNAAALANLYGTGDGCSAYGNRNFWRMFWDWFGSPVEQSPVGNVDVLQAVPGGVGIWGWALDSDTSNPIQVQVNLNGNYLTTATADAVRTDVGQRYGLGDKHGFALNVAVPAGVQRICVWGINVGSGRNIEFGCWTVTVGGDPTGSIDTIVQQPGGFAVFGWGLDPDTASPITMQVNVDGRYGGQVQANGSRSDIAARYPGFGDKHGFNLIVKTSPGPHRICLWGINTGGGQNKELQCIDVTQGGAPMGQVEVLNQEAPGSITAYGYALDPDTVDPINIQFNLDGNYLTTVKADGKRTGLGILDAYGSNHGFSTKLTVPAGKHTICLWGINVASGQNRELSCNVVEIGGSPTGAIENMVQSFGQISVYGWSYDKDTADPIGVQINVDGRYGASGTANAGRSDLKDKSIPAAWGVNHGFGVTTQIFPGTHTICAWGLNTGYGANNAFACMDTTVSGNPQGKVEYIGPFGGNLGVYGYAADPDTGASIDVHVYLDGTFAAATTANGGRTDLGGVYPAAWGTNHGYGVQFPASPGTHQVCAYAINQYIGDNTLLGCYTVTK